MRRPRHRKRKHPDFATSRPPFLSVAFVLECEDGAGFLRPVQRGLQLREEVSVVRLWLVLGSRRARLLRWPRPALLSSPSSRLLLLLLEGGIQRLQVPLLQVGDAHSAVFVPIAVGTEISTRRHLK